MDSRLCLRWVEFLTCCVWVEAVTDLPDQGMIELIKQDADKSFEDFLE
jgi:hypothetical protein